MLIIYITTQNTCDKLNTPWDISDANLIQYCHSHLGLGQQMILKRTQRVLRGSKTRHLLKLLRKNGGHHY